jgi:hypothetical protein
MLNINIPGSGHVGPTDEKEGYLFLPYTDEASLAILQKAIAIIQDVTLGNKKNASACNTVFERLPAGRSFNSLWNDRRIWINYDPINDAGRYGATISVDAITGADITISAFAFAIGEMQVAATLIHELAHVNGASSLNRDAESTLLSCLPGTFNGSIFGRLWHSNIARNRA